MSIEHVRRLEASRVTGTLRGDAIESAIDIVAWPQQGSGELLMKGQVIASVWNSPNGLIVELPRLETTISVRLKDLMRILTAAAQSPP